MVKNDFIEYYKTLTTADLLEILASKKDYQDSAIETAQQELNNRSLSESELVNAKQQLFEKALNKEKQKQKIADTEIKLKNAVNKLADTINPIQKEQPTSDKLIKTISIIYGGFFLLQLLSDFKMTLATIQDISRYPAYSIISLAPLILIPVASILFFIKKTFGWVLLTGLINYLTIGVLWAFVGSWKYSSGSSGGLSSLFPGPSLISFLVPLAILAGTLYLLCKPDIREVFKISKGRMQSTLVISGLFMVLLLVEA